MDDSTRRCTPRRPWRHRRPLAIVAAATAMAMATATVLAAGPGGGSAAATGSVTLYAAPGAGGDCLTPATPCILTDALVTATGGTYAGDAVTIDAAAGTYAELASQYEIEAAPLASLTVAGAGASSTTLQLGEGGSLTIANGSVTLSGFTVSNPITSGGPTNSYGAVTNLGSFTASNDDFYKDGSSYEGGGAIASGGALTLTGDTFWDDEVTNETNVGGAVDISGGSAVASNDTFVGDSAVFGGAIADSGASLQLSGDTFSADSASYSGGGALYAAYRAKVTTTSSIYDQAGCDTVFATITDGGYNVASDNSCGLGPTSTITTPGAIALASNPAANGSAGAPTLSIPATSAAFEEVSAASCSLTSDERGQPRPGVSGAACDAGAFELQGARITSAASTTFAAGQPGSFTVQATGDPTVTLSESGALPGGVGFVDNGDGTATLSGTPQAGTGNSWPITITAANGVGPDAVQHFTLTVDEAPAITSHAATTFAVGTPGSFEVTTSGYPTPAISESGALPGGVSFADNGNGTATLSGTPERLAGGQYPLSFTASNGVAPDAVQPFILDVDEAPVFTADSPPLTATSGTSYHYTFVAAGFPPPQYSLAAGAPAWLSINPVTGTLSGTVPSGINAFAYSVLATNPIGSATAGPFTVQVSMPAPIVTLVFEGALHYLNSGPITSGTIIVEPPSGGINSVVGRVTIAGLRGGSATIAVRIVRLGQLYIGWVRVVDPSVDLETTALVLEPLLHRTPTGEVTGTATGWHRGRRYELTFTL